MKLTKEQRYEMIGQIIENDAETLHRPYDIFHAYFYGITPYKDMLESEILDYYEDAEMEIPKQENLALLCTENDCYDIQDKDGEFCKIHKPFKN